MKAVLSHLDNVNQKLPIVGGTVTNVLDQIEKLLTRRACDRPFGFRQAAGCPTGRR